MSMQLDFDSLSQSVTISQIYFPNLRSVTRTEYPIFCEIRLDIVTEARCTQISLHLKNKYDFVPYWLLASPLDLY